LYLLLETMTDSSCGIWTNIIALTLLRMVATLSTVRIYDEFPRYLFVNLLIPLTVGIYSVSVYGLTTDRMDSSYRVFYSLRVVTIFFNTICYFLTAFFSTRLHKRVEEKTLTEFQAKAIRILVFRMRAYPIVQVLMRIGPIWHGYNSRTESSPDAAYADAITSPTCGIVYFFAFMYIQPTLRNKILRGLITQYPCLKPILVCCLDTSTIESNDQRHGNYSSDIGGLDRDSRISYLNQLQPSEISNDDLLQVLEDESIRQSIVKVSNQSNISMVTQDQTFNILNNRNHSEARGTSDKEQIDSVNL
jgi:hypothetical protein